LLADRRQADAGDIKILLEDQVEQQVEGAVEDVEFDQQPLAVGAGVGGRLSRGDDARSYRSCPLVREKLV